MFRPAFRLSAIVIAVAASVSPILLPRSLRAQKATPHEVPAPSPSAQESPAPPPRPISRSPLHFALPRHEYLCDGGTRLVILVQTNAARLTLNDHTYDMKQVETASGTKYSEGSVVWSGDGDDGVLEDDRVPGKPQMLATNCHLKTVYPPVAPGAGRVTGTVTYRQHMALPPDAVVLVHLQDVYLPDAPSPFLAEYKTTLGERQAPIRFTLKFDPAKIDPKHPYTVEARILVHDQLRFTNDTAYPVLTQGHPSKIDMILVPVDAPSARKP
jgi:putative lipoprotein